MGHSVVEERGCFQSAAGGGVSIQGRSGRRKSRLCLSWTEFQTVQWKWEREKGQEMEKEGKKSGMALRTCWIVDGQPEFVIWVVPKDHRHKKGKDEFTQGSPLGQAELLPDCL